MTAMTDKSGGVKCSQGVLNSLHCQGEGHNYQLILHLGKLRMYIVSTSVVVQWLRLCAPNAKGPGSIPGQGTRFHMLQLRFCILQLNMLCATMETEDPKSHN